jgi:hypothetical protein
LTKIISIAPSFNKSKLAAEQEIPNNGGSKILKMSLLGCNYAGRKPATHVKIAKTSGWAGEG